MSFVDSSHKITIFKLLFWYSDSWDIKILNISIRNPALFFCLHCFHFCLNDSNLKKGMIKDDTDTLTFLYKTKLTCGSLCSRNSEESSQNLIIYRGRRIYQYNETTLSFYLKKECTQLCLQLFTKVHSHILIQLPDLDFPIFSAFATLSYFKMPPNIFNLLLN